MKHRYLVSLFLIIILSTVLRTINLDKVPASLFGDELDVGYQAYSILKTGQDLQDQTFPTLMHSLSEYRAPGFIYSAVPFVAIFGLNEWGVRLPAVFWGIVSIIGLFFLTRMLFDAKIATFAALSLSLSPWHIQYSRGSFEVTMLLSLLIFATLFFIKGFKNKWGLVISSIIFGLTPYVYSTAVVFMPVLILLLVLIYKTELKSMIIGRRNYVFISVIILLLVLAPFIYQTMLGKSGARFGIISIFTDQVALDKVTLAQKAGLDLGLGGEKIFHNKPLIWAQEFSLNYLRTFSPEFLFLTGDPNFRQSIHEMGEMYYYELVLLLIGIWVLVKSNKNGKVILGWFLLAPIPAALTYDGGFHATRAFIMLPALMIMVGVGIDFLVENLKSRWKYLAFMLVFMAIFNISFYLHRYFLHFPVESWRAWQYGFKQTMQYVDSNQSKYKQVWINNTYEPSLIRYLFWTKYDPQKFHQFNKGDQISNNIIAGFDGFSLENKYYFGKVNRPFEEMINSQILYIASARDDITNPETLKDRRVKLLKTIYSPTNQPIFYIITGNDKQ